MKKYGVDVVEQTWDSEKLGSQWITRIRIVLLGQWSISSGWADGVCVLDVLCPVP